MSIEKLLKPFARVLKAPTPEELEKCETLHSQLRVSADYLEILQAGVLGMDLDKHAAVNWKKVKDAPWLASEISYLGRAQSVTKENLAEAFNKHFYLVGSTYGGGLVVQWSTGEQAGKLAMLPDYALGDLEVMREPKEPVLESLLKAKLIEPCDMTMLEYVELRFAKAKKPKRRPVLNTEAKLRKALDKAVANIGSGTLSIERFDVSFELPEDLELSEVSRVEFIDCGFDKLPERLSTLDSLFSLSLEDCPLVTTIPQGVCERLTQLRIAGCPGLEFPRALPVVLDLTLEMATGALPTLNSLNSLTTLTSLEFKGAAFGELPDISSLSALQSLSISECPNLHSVPDSICALTALKQIEIYDTALERVPEEIGKLANLDRLVLGSWGSNKLKTLPDSLCDLDNLQILWLANNQLEAVPTRIGELKKLRILTLEDNQLTELPESLFELQPFTLGNELSFENNPMPPGLVKGYKKRIKAISASHAAARKAARLAEEAAKATEGLLKGDPRVHVIFDPDLRLPGRYVCGFFTAGETIVAVGGFQSEMVFRSTDGGAHFEKLKMSPGPGLRSVMIVDAVIWVCGERGFVARSTDDGQSFETIDVGASACLQTLLHADGALWATGDNGAFQSFDEGVTWSKVAVEGEITRPQVSEYGVLLPSDKGLLYLWHQGKIQQTALQAEASVWAVTATSNGSILAACGDGTVYRSEDEGASFALVTTGTIESLENILGLADGRVLVVGAKGTLLVSSDDGRSFESVAQGFTNEWIFGLAAWKTGALLGCGEKGLVAEFV